MKVTIDELYGEGFFEEVVGKEISKLISLSWDREEPQASIKEDQSIEKKKTFKEAIQVDTRAKIQVNNKGKVHNASTITL